VVIRVRSGLCATDRTFDVGATDRPLIPVLCEWLEVDGFDLYMNQYKAKQNYTNNTLTV